MDNLATLIRLAKLDLDEKRKLLAALRAKDAALVQQTDALLAERAREISMAKEKPEEHLTLGPFIVASQNREKVLTATRLALAREISAAQEALQEGFETLKRYEIAQDQRDKAARRDNLRRETIQLDEVAARRGKGSE